MLYKFLNVLDLVVEMKCSYGRSEEYNSWYYYFCIGCERYCTIYSPKKLTNLKGFCPLKLDPMWVLVGGRDKNGN